MYHDTFPTADTRSACNMIHARLVLQGQCVSTCIMLHAGQSCRTKNLRRSCRTRGEQPRLSADSASTRYCRFCSWAFYKVFAGAPAVATRPMSQPVRAFASTCRCVHPTPRRKPMPTARPEICACMRSQASGAHHSSPPSCRSSVFKFRHALRGRPVLVLYTVNAAVAARAQEQPCGCCPRPPQQLPSWAPDPSDPLGHTHLFL